MRFDRLPTLLALAAAVAAPIRSAGQDVAAYFGATVWDGTGAPATARSLIVRNGRIVAVGSAPVPEGARRVDLRGKWVIPGLINAHGHVSGRWAPDFVTDPSDRIVQDLALYAEYGVTTVNSLGGGGRASIKVRDLQSTPLLKKARLRVAGPVITATDPDEGQAAVDHNADMGVDWIKFRVDDNLGTAPKMSPATYRAIIERAHARGLRVATHLFYLGDAKGLLRAGTDLVAHSVRDVDVDADVIGLLRDRGVCYVPTLTREVSTFVYAERPDFFDDPFFMESAHLGEVERLSEPDFRSRMAESATAARYREALAQAQRNLRTLAEAGASIAFGTDSGPAARFPGYFEHMELALMVEAGLTPADALRSATGVAAGCLGLDDLGTLEPGKWADFLVLGADPLADIAATRSLERVYIAGNQVR